MVKLRRSILMSVVCILIISLFAGCAETTDNTSPSEPTSGDVDEVSSEAPSEEVAEPEEEIKLAFILKTLGNPYWVAMKDGILAEAEAKGVTADVFAGENESDYQGQLAKFESVMNNPDYSGIGFAALSAVSLVSPAGQATEMGIPLVAIDEKVDPVELEAAGGKLLGFCTTDNRAVGEKGAKSIVDVIGEGEVAIIEGMAGVAAGDQRKEGATAYFESIDGITIVASQPADWDRNKALDVATNILQTNPDIKAFYCANDTMALGAAQAVLNAGVQDQVIVIGTDGIDEAYQAISDGNLYATIAQDPAKMGATALNMLLDAINNGTAATTAEPETTFIDSILVTQDNVSSFLK